MSTSHKPLSTESSDSASPLAKFGIGQSLRRVEDKRFLTGKGNYADDDVEPGMLHAVFLRSIHAHADVKAIDITKALAAKGVIAVYVGDDWRKAGLVGLPVRPSIKNTDGSQIANPPRPGLATDRVRYVGECVAMVIAESARQAEDALELINVEYVPLEAVADVRVAASSKAPEIWPHEAPGNISFDWSVGNSEQAASALKDAAHVFELDLVNNRLVPNSMEPRGVVVRYDKTSLRITLSGSIQNPFGYQGLLCDLFGWPKERLRCFASDVGGGFGGKNQVQQEHAMMLFACDKLRRPIKWINDRTGSFTSDAHARDLFSKVQLGLDSSGHFVGLVVDTIANLGAHLSTNGALIPTLPTAAVLGGAYTIPAISMNVKGVFTNTVPVDAYRGAGRPEATYLLERIIDVAARKLKMSPTKLRQKNLIKRAQIPYKTPLGREIDCGDFTGVLQKAVEIADFDGFANRAKLAKKQGARRGIGIAYYLEATLGPPTDAARITFTPDGRARLSVGTQSNGQGHETTFPQLAASQFGIAPDLIDFHQADTDATPDGGGHGGSRSLHLGGTAILLAARQIIEKGKRIAAYMLEADQRDIEFKPGKYLVAGTNSEVSFADVVAASFNTAKLEPGIQPGLDETAKYEREGFNYPYGCHVCEVEVEIDTGVTRLTNYVVVNDFGRIINPMVVRGQVVGGVVQGIGQALTEQTCYDAQGQLVTASFMDYCLPRAADLSAINVELVEGFPTDTNPLGAKGCGEAGATGSSPALVNAVVDALKEFGVEHIDMPLTSEKVWSATRTVPHH